MVNLSEQKNLLDKKNIKTIIQVTPTELRKTQTKQNL